MLQVHTHTDARTDTVIAQVYKRINEDLLLFFLAVSAGTLAHAKMKTLLHCLMTDKLKHRHQPLLPYSSVAVY